MQKITAFLIILISVSFTVKGQNSAAATEKQQLKWFTDARFGMFIHWDMSSIAGTEISWSRKGSKPLDIFGDPAGYVEDPVYDHLYEKFNPTSFNATAWVNLAKAAGMKYIVFTAKHHGGFCMWDTKYLKRLSLGRITRLPGGGRTWRRLMPWTSSGRGGGGRVRG